MSDRAHDNRAAPTASSGSTLPPYTDLAFFDALRGLAALYVVIHHANLKLWHDPLTHSAVAAGDHTSARYLISYLFLYGHQAVLLFFLISGFCIHYRQARSVATAEASGRDQPYPLDIRTFAWRRLKRLYPPFLLALVLTAGLDFAGDQLNPGFYDGNTAYHEPDEAWYSPKTIIGNLMMQSGVIVPAFGTNRALWSLAYEFWFYALYPFLLLMSFRLGARPMIVMVGCVSAFAILMEELPGITVPQWFSSVGGAWFVWACGALIAEAYAGRIHLPSFRWLTPCAIAWLILLAVTSDLDPQRLPTHPTLRSVLWGAGCAVLVAHLAVRLPTRPRRLVERLSHRLAFLGAISYSLYLVHMPWFAFLSALWLTGHASLPVGLELHLLGVVSAIALGAALWYVAERRFITAHPGASPQVTRRSTAAA